MASCFTLTEGAFDEVEVSFSDEVVVVLVGFLELTSSLTFALVVVISNLGFEEVETFEDSSFDDVLF